MPNPESYTSPEPNFQDLDSPSSLEVKELIATIQHSHQLRAKMVNLESWALADTMDDFLPGFWSRFLENRRTSLKQFLKQKRAASQVSTDTELPTNSAPEINPLEEL